MPAIHRIQLSAPTPELIDELLDRLAYTLTSPRSGIALAGDAGVLISDEVVTTRDLGGLTDEVTIEHVGEYEEVRRQIHPNRAVYSLDDAMGIHVSLEEE